MIRARRTVLVLTAFGLLLLPSTARAQIDFSGVWQPIYQEDVPERLAGPALRDYVGPYMKFGVYVPEWKKEPDRAIGRRQVLVRSVSMAQR